MKILTWGICLVVFCLPLYLVRFSVFGIPTTVLELMIYILFIIWLINRLIRGQLLMRSQRKLSFLNYHYFVPILLILIGVSLATIFSSDLRISAGIWKGWFVDPLLFFVVIISVVKNFEQIKKVFCSLFLSGVVVSVISLIYLIQGKLDPVGRLQAFYNSPNYLAMYLAPVLIIGAGYYLFTFLGRPSETASGTPPSLVPPLAGHHARSGCVTRKKIIPGTFILLSVICLLLSIIFTKSFGAWLGIIAAIGLFLYLRSGLEHKWVVLGLVLIVVLASGYFALTQRTSSFEARLVIWQKAWQIFKTNPILGIGPGTFGNYFPSYPQWGVPQPHNLYLAFLLQTGILGFVGFVWLLGWFFRAGIRNFQFFRPRRISLGLTIFNFQLMSVMVYILVHGLVDTTYWKNDLSVLFWIIVGLMVVLKNK